MECKKVGLLLIVLVASTILINADTEPVRNYFFTLELYRHPWGSLTEEANLISQFLKEIGINVEIKSTAGCCGLRHPWDFDEWDMFLFECKSYDDFLDIRECYLTSANYTSSWINLVKLDRSIPYQNESERMLLEGEILFDFEERVQLYHKWQNLVMDYILPVVPLFTMRTHEAVWPNTRGFDASYGLFDCLPYMSFDGLHEGQESLDEFNVAVTDKFSLDKYVGGYGHSLINEPLMQIGPDLIPLKTGLIRDWEMIDNTHFKFSLRDNIFWNPSYNITENNDTTVPIENLPIMTGLQGTNSTGTNQKVTAKDAVFTLLTMDNPLTDFYHITNHRDNWLSDCYVDEVNELDFHVIIDRFPETPEKDIFADFWYKFDIPLIPEFFLNSTENEISFTNGGIKCVGLYEGIDMTPEWNLFLRYGFGCGKYMNYYVEEFEWGVEGHRLLAQLKRSPYWFGVGAIDGSEGLEPFVEDFNIHIKGTLDEQFEYMKMGKLDYHDITNFISEIKDACMMVCPYEIQSTLMNHMSLLAFNLQRDFIGGLNNSIWIEERGKTNYTKACAVRKAICYAIDREEINQVCNEGRYLISHSCLAPSFGAYYNWDVKRYQYNLDLAWQWMEAAGYKQKDLRVGSSLGDFIGTIITGFIAITLISKLIRKKAKKSY
ncbi:MAG: hypothetical protein HGN29_06465 [Asgard group archaeon]|nr:hypothetical protein [Asgard group archaeon]